MQVDLVQGLLGMALQSVINRFDLFIHIRNGLKCIAYVIIKNIKYRVICVRSNFSSLVGGGANQN